MIKRGQSVKQRIFKLEWQKESKYRNVKTVVDGIKFDSKKEANRYCELLILERAGWIKDLKIHPRFTLLPAYEKKGVKYRSLVYIADFSYYDTREKNNIVEDVKGYITKEFKLKQKMFNYFYPDLILEVV